MYPEPLNFPDFEYNIKKAHNKIWIHDPVRKKYVVLTPEEWVRQHLINFLIEMRGYPKSLMRIEHPATYNKQLKRCDLLAYDKKGTPVTLVECKAPSVKIDQKVLSQTAIYAHSIKPQYIGITNGLQHLSAKLNTLGTGTPEIINDFPHFPS